MLMSFKNILTVSLHVCVQSSQGRKGEVVLLKSLELEYHRHFSPSLQRHRYQAVSLNDGVLGPLKTCTNSVNLNNS